VRWIGRLILLILFCTLALALYQRASSWPAWRTTSVVNWEQDFSAYPVFWLEEQTPLTFHIPANAEQIRLMFTATLAQQSEEYRIDYQVTQQQSGMMTPASRTFSLNNTVPVVNLVTGQLPDRFFDSPDGMQAQRTSDFFIDNDKQDPMQRIVLSLAPGSGVRVAMRVSVLERKSDSDLAVIWQRMHRDKRAALMAENIYPQALVPEQQRRDVLKYSWLPLGPEGETGVDHHSASLFIKNNQTAAAPAQEQAIVSHMLAARERVFSFINTAEVAAETLRCDPLDGSKLLAGSEPQWLELLIQDINMGQNSRRLRFNAAQLQQALPVQPNSALYQITSNKLCQVRLFNASNEEISLPARLQRGYLIEQQQSLSYALALGAQALQPIKIDIRGLASQVLGQAQDPPQGRVYWQILAANDKPLLSGELNINQTKDSYQALPLSRQGSEQHLFTNTSHYILAHAEGVRLQISSSGPQVLVNVFTRPLMLAHSREVDHQDGLPQWFTLLPVAYHQLKAERRSRIIYRQPRPLLINSGDAAYISQWRVLDTLENQSTYPIFSREEQGSADVQGKFQALKPQQQGLEFADGQRKTLSPSLVYIRPKSSMVKKISVSIDNQVFDYWLNATAGKLNLPSMTAGLHQLEILGAEQSQWYINRLNQPMRGNVARIRQAYPLEKCLTFNISKESQQELISFHYFPATPQAHRVQVTLQHAFILGQYSAHTVPIRRFALPAQVQAGSAYLLNQASKPIWPAYAIKFPLQADLPQGQYRLQLCSDRQLSGFVQASNTTDHITHLSEYYREVDNAL
jgi:hypothetical protein